MGEIVSAPFQEELNSYENIKKIEVNGIEVFKNRSTNERFERKGIVFDSEEKSKEYFEIHEHRLQFKSPYLIKLIKHKCHIADLCCKNVYCHYAIWEYCEENLASEIEKRKSRNQLLPGREFGKIVRECIQGLAELEDKKFVHRKLNVECICFDDNRNVKIIDPLIFVSNETIQSKSGKDKKYLLPEECELLKDPANFEEYTKSNVLSLGCILLELALLDNFIDCTTSQGIDPQKVYSNLEKLGELYGQRIKLILSKMLAEKENRLSFKQLQSIEREQSVNSNHLKENKNTENYMRNSPEVFPYNQPLLQEKKTHQNISPFPQTANFTNHNENIYFAQSRFPIDIRLQKVNTNNKPFMMTNFPSYPQYQPYPESNHYIVKEIIYPQIIIKKVSKSSDLFPSSNECLQIRNSKEKERETLAEKTSKMSSNGNHYQKSERLNNNNLGIKNTQSITYQEEESVNEVNQSYNNKHHPPLSLIKSNYNGENEDSNTHSYQKEYIVESFQGGSQYRGYKLNNMRHGEGQFYYKDGGMYDGMWEEDKMNGFGKLYYESGKLAYEGYWKNDLFEGQGKLYNEKPKKLDDKFDYHNFDGVEEFWESYEGNFKEDVKEFKGKMILTNQEYFIGNFRDDQADGMGEFFCGSGRVVKGKWKENKLIEIE